MAVHSDSSQHAAEEAFLRCAGNAADAKFCKGHFMYINAWRNITRDPIENNFLAVCDESSLVSSNDYFVSDLFIPGARLTQYGLSDHNAAKHRWYYFPKMQMDEVLLFKQFETDTSLPGRMTFHTHFVDPIVRPDVLKRQSIECSAFLFFPEFESNICPALPSNAVAKEVASHAERGTWDLSLVRELSEWMRDDAFSEVLVGRVFVTLGVKFAEMAKSERKFPARAVYQGNSLWSRSGRSVYEIFDEVSHGLRHFGLPVQDLVQEFLGERIPLVCLVDNQQAITPVKRV